MLLRARPGANVAFGPNVTPFVPVVVTVPVPARAAPLLTVTAPEALVVPVRNSVPPLTLTAPTVFGAVFASVSRPGPNVVRPPLAVTGEVIVPFRAVVK